MLKSQKYNPMKKIITIIFSGLISTLTLAQNCEINVSASEYDISCGSCVTLTAFGQNTNFSVLNEDFNTGGFGPGWSGTPGAVNFSNPCSGGGVDGTPHAWMDNNTDVPRELVSASYDFSSSVNGVSICFDMMYAIQGEGAPCEGPDEPNEGVYLEYSTDGGSTWTTINYFDPLGGNNSILTSWNNYCFDLPAVAITANTQIRWYQNVGSGQDYDHWGIDNLQIYFNDIASEVTWIADPANGFPAYTYGIGVGGGTIPTPVCPTATTTYTAQIVTGTGDVCTQTVTINVVSPVINSSISASPLTICTSNGECADIIVLTEVVIDPGGPITYENIQPITYGNGLLGSGLETVNVNVQDLNMQTVSPNSITSICIDYLTFEPNAWGYLDEGINDLEISIVCPGGTEIVLVPDEFAPEGINGGLFGSDVASYYQNVCFVPAAGQTVNNIPNGSTAALPVTGTYQTFTDFNNLAGCTSNGVWELHLDNNNVWGGDGELSGWSITFNDDPILGTPNFTWNLPANLSDPNSLTPTTCIPGTYIIDIDNGNPGCGTAQETITITGATGGDPSFTLADFCSGLANQATITGDIGGTFAFNPLATDGATVHTTTGEITNGVSGTTYTIEYSITGSCPASSTQTVNVLSGNPSFTTTDFCAGTSNNATITGDNGGTFTFNPTVIDGATINGITGEISNGIGGTTYTLDYSTSGTCASSSTQNVVINPISNASFTTSNYCFGLVNQATITGDAGGTFTFTPAITDGATINATTGGITNGIAGTTYTLEYSIAGICPASTTETVTVLSGDASFTTIDFCENAVNNAIITGDIGGVFTFNPSVSDGATINGLTGEISNETGGTTYTIEYSTTVGCALSTTQNVNIGASDDASFTTSNYCMGSANNATITGTTGGTFTFNPIVMDGATVNGSTGEITSGTASTQYNLEYTTTGSCPTSSIQSVLTNPLPSITAGTLQTVCDGDNVTLTATNPDNAILVWDNSVTNNSAFTPTLGTTNYIVTATLLGCISTDNVNVTVNPVPTFTIVGTDPTTCGGTDGTIIISGLNPTISYDVSYLDVTVQGPNSLLSTTAGEILLSGLDAGAYTNFVVSLLGCSPSDNTVINLTDPTAPLINAGIDQTICEPYQVALTATNPNSATLTWSNGVSDGILFTPNTGITTYTITATLNGCSNSDVVDVTANPLPIINAGLDQIICEGDVVILSGTNPDNATLVWDNGVSNNLGFTPTVGMLNYTVTATLLGCISMDNVDVTVNPLPNVNFSSNPQGCAPLDVHFTNTNASSVTCLWDYGNGNTSTFCGNTSTTYPNPGTFSVSLTITDNNNCTNSLIEVDYVTIEAMPEAIFNVDNNFINSDEIDVDFYNTSLNATNYVWKFGDGSFPEYMESPQHTFPPTGNMDYLVTLIASNSINCIDSVSTIIHINDELVYYVPNAFTPDGDAFNQIFKPIFTSGIDVYDYHFMIFNRWGEIVFESFDANYGWNGRYGEGELKQDEVYTWKINFKENISDKKHEEIGYVTLLR